MASNFTLRGVFKALKRDVFHSEYLVGFSRVEIDAGCFRPASAEMKEGKRYQ